MPRTPPPLSTHLLTLARVFRILERAATDGTEVSLAQFRTLGSLLGGDERATVLAQRLAVPKPTMTAVVNALVAQGFVAREGTPDDRRVVRLSITPDGRDAYERAAAVLAVELDDLLDRIEHPDRVLEALDLLRGALDDRFGERFGPGDDPSAVTR